MNKKIFSNFLWRFAERCGAQGVTFIVSIVLARVLDPAVYGTVALVTVFTSLLQVFVDSGLGTSLIQKKDADDTDFSTVFFFNMAMCLVIYALMFFLAPAIASFYGDDTLVPVIRVTSLIIVISGLKNVQQAYVSRNLLFKRFFFATLGGTIAAAVLGIWMAYRGCGVWALVTQMLLNSAVDTAILWITVKWRPKAVFSFERLKGLLSYGWKLLAASLLDTFYKNLRTLIIGKKYSEADLAFYNRGELFPQLIVSNINSSVDSVLLPTMSAEQCNRERVREMTRKAISVSSYIMWPTMAGLCVCAEPLVRLLLTDKWLVCVPYVRIFCLTYAFQPIHTANLNAIKALGRSDLFFKLEIMKKVVGISIICVSMWYGVMAMAYGAIIDSLFCQLINTAPNRKLLNYTYPEQLRDILPSMLLSLTMAVIVYGVNFLAIPDICKLLIQVPLGMAIYIGGSKLLHFEDFDYILNAVKNAKKA
jgi:O-antigen/teichoic acid export membrane protein